MRSERGRSEWGRSGRFESLKERLLRAGVAPKRVRRYVSELSDHLDDLVRQQRAAGYEGQDAQLRARALLGSDEELAKGWLDDPRLKSFTARAPWAVIPAVTVGTLMLALALPVIAWVMIGEAGGWIGVHVTAPAWFVVFSDVWSAATSFLVPPAVALALALVAHRQRLNPAWALVPAIILLPLSPHIGVAPHQISVGAGDFFRLTYQAGRSHSAFPSNQWPLIAARLLVTLAPGLWLYRWQKRIRAHAV
jgi:hypothetical protein